MYLNSKQIDKPDPNRDRALASLVTTSVNSSRSFFTIWYVSIVCKIGASKDVLAKYHHVR